MASLLRRYVRRPLMTSLAPHHIPLTALRSGRLLHTKEMQESELMSLKASEGRLMSDLHYSCQFGKGTRWGKGETDTGMSRLALSQHDKDARDWFVQVAQSSGCHITIDEMGNIFAIRPGLKDGPPTMAGSHLDTQPQGGRYDGILGICAGLEMIKVLNDNWVETEYPVGVVNWTNEEGARFPISMLSSSVYAGHTPLSTAHDCLSLTQPATSLLSELQSIGYHGTTPCSYAAFPFAAHFELHIEQGPRLETAGATIGIVTGAQAYRWFTIHVHGQSSHTGTTPLSARRDALVAAAQMLLWAQRVAARKGGLASSGIIDAAPGSVNSVAERVRFSLDVRGASDALVREMEAEMRGGFEAIAAGRDVDGLATPGVEARAVELEVVTDSVSPAVSFHEDCIRCVSESAASLFQEDFAKQTRKMVSGAGHDSVMTNRVCPTSMIFVPSKDGISHNPSEYTSPEDCATGAQVLLGAVIRYDRLRKAKAR